MATKSKVSPEDNQKTIDRLQAKRDKLVALRLKQAEDAHTVTNELEADKLAQEEARLDAEIEIEEARTGVSKLREARPALASELDARAEEEAKVAQELADAAAGKSSGKDN